MPLAHIVCVDPHFGIGRHGSIPWVNREEMRLFRTVTIGHTVLMGRKTWESLPEIEIEGGRKAKFLKGRRNVVISRTLDTAPECTEVCRSPEEFLAGWETEARREQAFVIGGSELYRSTAALADFIYLSVLHEAYECDAFYPDDVLSEFTLQGKVTYDSFKLHIYRRDR